MITVGPPELRTCWSRGRGESADSSLTFLHFLAWAAGAYHDQLVGGAGQVCCRLAWLAGGVAGRRAGLSTLLHLLCRHQNQAVQYSASRALAALLPLTHCGQDEPLSSSDILGQIIDRIVGPKSGSDGGGLLGSLGVEEGAGLGEEEAGLGGLEEEAEPVGLEQRAWLLTVLTGYVTHEARARDEGGWRPAPNCNTKQLDEESLCQEMQVSD